MKPKIPFARPMGNAEDDIASLSSANFGYAGFAHMLRDEELAALRMTIPRVLTLPRCS